MEKTRQNSRATFVGAVIVVLVLLAAWWLATRGAPERHSVAVVTSPTPIEPPASTALDATRAARATDERTPLGDSHAEAMPLRARPRGVVRDADTGEPLPEYLLRAYSFADAALGSFVTQSGAHGEFAFQAEVPVGELRFEFVDHPGLASRNSEYATVDFAPTAQGIAPALELRADTGPTFFFDVELPAGLTVSDFDVQLLHGRPFQSTPYGSPPIHATLRAPSSDLPQPLHPWVRFGAAPSFSAPGWVELRSSDGRWRGGSWVERLAGSSPEPVRVVIESAAWLVARVVLPPNGDVVGANFRLVERLAPGETRAPRVHGGNGGGSAANPLEIRFLEPGEYHLSARDANWSPYERDVTIVRGENDLGTILLEPRPVMGEIRGVIESRSGKYEGACHVSLSRTPFEHDAFFDHSIDFVDDGTGKLVAQFELENVTAGEWFLYVHCHDGFTHTNSLLTVVAPKDDVRIVLEDAAIDVEFELVDAKSGASLDEESGVSWECGEAWEYEHGPTVVAEGLPDAPERFTFVASAPGYVPKRGTAAALERTPASASSRARLKGVIALERGFGGELHVRDRTRWSAVAGVEIFADDVLLGATDAHGKLWFTLPAPPSRVRIEKPGWRWVATGDADPRTGELANGPEFGVEMVEVE